MEIGIVALIIGGLFWFWFFETKPNRDEIRNEKRELRRLKRALKRQDRQDEIRKLRTMVKS